MNIEEDKDNEAEEEDVVHMTGEIAEGRESVCSLPVEEGSCTRSRQRWYYSQASRKCISFNYTGCSGNANNFRSEMNCARYCINGLETQRRARRA